ncbi:hypothetical protein CLF_112036 [Clonorchis sinensis]|uniref:Uncharacterized protein n=1 Tax=Clonorchis sinensis TaxID=79923 RepID=G7YM80_CLOSI|nr:hypothetical protein CLF_112036 [Clonorchis sinensis]
MCVYVTNENAKTTFSNPNSFYAQRTDGDETLATQIARSVNGATSTTEYKGMPEEWLQWLRAANIPFHERERNPELVIEVLQCYDAATHHAQRQKFLTTNRSKWGVLQALL